MEDTLALGANDREVVEVQILSGALKLLKNRFFKRIFVINCLIKDRGQIVRGHFNFL